MNSKTNLNKTAVTHTPSIVYIKKLTVSGMLVALTVSLSGFSIPIGASKCFPIQHLVNVLAGVFLGPAYGVAMAFVSSLIRNLSGTGTLLAFPGSIVGAYLSALLFQKTGKLLLAYVGEITGTGLIGALLSYPVAMMILGKDVAVFFFVVPFLMSTVCGTVFAAFLLEALRRLGLLTYIRQLIGK
ncbi:energy coupling factor transporter S component ThiW [Clostridium boliviensis]|uniref:Energy coupling factor transporter S component ThiW n=1 Tax=Clostridium boliviensis TaxID=318465 RepID=A0ABU4GKQ9_9CLOT|nr:energy coupling factor transporter S component ThiW [Clostridium boliviensis]MDW2798196.1 energy coupling factor transporter S component ThiW [Clostridium boliviensis]